MMQKKDKTVQQLRMGIEHLMKKNKIKVFQGTASFKSVTELSIRKDSSKNEAEIISSKKSLLLLDLSPKKFQVCPLMERILLPVTTLLPLLKYLRKWLLLERVPSDSSWVQCGHV